MGGSSLKKLSRMKFAAAGGAVKWFPGHMFAATRAIRDRLKLADLVVEVRDARIPLSSANEDLQHVLEHKRRIIALNKKDLANPNILHKWIRHFDSMKQDSIAVNALIKSSVRQLLSLVELKLKELISREPTLLVMVVGVPNVGKSAVINSIRQIALSRFPDQEKIKRAAVGPLPGVTQDIAGYKIAHRPSIYVLDTPGVLVPTIRDMEAGLKLALTGAVKDSVVGEERLAQYLLAILNTRGTPFHWKQLNKQIETQCPENSRCIIDELTPGKKKLDDSDLFYVEGVAKEVARTLYLTLSKFEGDLQDECAMESLIETQLTALHGPFKISQKSSQSGREIVSKKLLMLFRSGKLGPFILDKVPGNV